MNIESTLAETIDNLIYTYEDNGNEKYKFAVSILNDASSVIKHYDNDITNMPPTDIMHIMDLVEQAMTLIKEVSFDECNTD